MNPSLSAERRYPLEFIAASPQDRLNPLWFDDNKPNENLLRAVREVMGAWATLSAGSEIPRVLLYASNANGTWRDKALAGTYSSLLCRRAKGESIPPDEIRQLPFIHHDLLKLLQGNFAASKGELKALTNKLSKPSDLDFLIMTEQGCTVLPILETNYRIEVMPNTAVLKISLTEPVTGTNMHAIVYTGKSCVCNDGERMLDVMEGNWYKLRHCQPGDKLNVS